MREYIQIGKIEAAYGLSGEVLVSHKLKEAFPKDKLSTIFIAKNKNSYIPYFPSSIKIKNTHKAYIKFEDINSKEEAHAILRKEIFIPKKEFEKIATRESEWYYLGFKVKEEKQILGEISDIIVLPQGQLLAQVFQEEKELMIPLSEQTITDLDDKNRIISVSLPDGLLDLYNES
ncbi:MAG TPA: ribosome maturation factor RimM [Chitinophagaceae bacterium]|nr:ribosome maturation factor RimM [Chitinophagaceae bacterium]